MSPFAIAAQTARRFGIYQCVACAEAIRQELLSAGLSGKWVEMRSRDGYDFIICYSYNNGKRAISQNGRHVAVQIDDTVFDNLHHDGMPYEAWVRDFAAVLGIEIVTTPF